MTDDGKMYAYVLDQFSESQSESSDFTEVSECQWESVWSNITVESQTA